MITDDVFEINPRELYSIVSVPIVAYNFPWQHYPDVEVKLQYSDEPNSIRIDEIVILDKDHTSKILPIFIQDSKKRTFKYRIIYHAADNKEVDAGWVDTSDEQISVRDPFPMKRTVEVVPNLNWNDISQAFVDLTYEDRANNILEDGSLSFSPTDMDSKRFTVDLANPDLRLVTYQVTVLFKDGRSFETPKSLTRDNA